MFISNYDKAKIKEDVEILKVQNHNMLEKYVKQTKLVNSLTVHLHNLEVRIAELEGKKPYKPATPSKWTKEKREEQSKRIKKMWADKRAKRLGSANVEGAPV